MLPIFITATDTDAGKTLIASALIYLLSQQGKRVAGFKPIAAGCQRVNNALLNDDAIALKTFANCQQTYEQVNPIAFEKPIAPHIAAKQENQAISVEQVVNFYQKLQLLKPDVIVTEGAGGWRLPLGNGEYLSKFAQQTNQQIILVVNMKLGCLNHAVLTYESIIRDGLNCIGWVANCPTEMPYLADNIEELQGLLPTKFLGKVGFCKTALEAVNCLSLPSN